MKKYVRIIFGLICILMLASCFNNKKIVNNKKTILPEVKNISKIEIVKNNSKVDKKIVKQEEIYKMISEIKEHANDSGKESINDQPVNIDDYIIIKLHHDNVDESPSIVYLYNNNGKSFIEQPYLGIWKIKKEVFDNISNKLTQ